MRSMYALLGLLVSVSVLLPFTRIVYATEKPEYNEQEAAWIEKHPVITLAIDNSYPPLNFVDEDEEMSGLCVDFVNAFAQKAGIAIEFKGSIWSIAIQKALNHEVDGVVNADATKARKAQLNFTEPYVTLPSGLVTLKNAPNLESVTDLSGKIICAKNNSSHLELIDKKSRAQILPIETLEEGLERVIKGEAFGVFDDVSVLGHLIAKYSFTNLKTNFIHYDDIVGVSRVGLRNDDPVMLSVVNKAILSLTKTERDEVQLKWFSLAIEKTVIERYFDWNLFLKILLPILAAAVILSVLVLLHTRKLKHVVEIRTRDLQKSEEKYRRIFDNSVVGFFQSNPAGRFFSVNPAFARMLHYDSPEELIDAITDIASQYYVEPTDRQRYQQILKQEGKVDGFEFKVRCKDGAQIWVSNSTRAYFDDDGSVIRYEGVINNITKRKFAEKALREGEDRLVQIIMSSPIPTFVIDDNHLTTHWNEALEKITGISANQVIGTNKHWMAFYSKERPVMADFIVDEVTEGEITKYYSGKLQKSVVVENAYAAEDFFPGIGENGRWLFFTAALLRDIEGQITGAVETLQDITERKMAEHSLRDSEEKYRLLVEFANDAIFIAQEYSIKFPNPRALELTGYYAEELEKIPLINLVHPDDRNLVQAGYESGLKGERLSPTDTFRIIHKSGTHLSVQINATPVIWDGKPAALTFLRDVTSQKIVEDRLRQAQKMESIGTLAGGIAHDFNNILSAILGYSELALADLSPGDPIKYNLESIHRSGERARDVVAQILAFSRKDEPVMIPVAMHLVIKDAMKLMRPAIPVTIDIKTQINLECNVLGDPSQLLRIIMNLCTNAYQAMIETGGKLCISLSQVTLHGQSASLYRIPAGAYAKLTVSDTGIGIPAEDVDRIFEPYFTTKDKGKGTGLGLAVVHGIVKSHGGTVQAESHIGKGTEFQLYLPLTQHHDDTMNQAKLKLNGGDEHILLIDDEPDILEIEKMMLVKLGYSISARHDPAEALDLFSRNPEQFDLVITDMTMPNMTGDKLAGELIKIRSNIPVILCTGFSEIMSKEKAASLGIKGFLMKPITMKDLSIKVRDLLDKNEW